MRPKAEHAKEETEIYFHLKKRGVGALEEQKGESMPRIGVVFTGVSFCYVYSVVICDM